MKTSPETVLKRSASAPSRRRPANRGNWRRTSVVLVLVAVTVILGLDLAAAPILRSVINRKFAAMPGYTGHVDGARLSLGRGRFELVDLVFTERGHETELPLARVPSATLNVSYAALLRGVVNAKITVDKPTFTVVKLTCDETTLPGKKKDDDKKNLANAAATQAKIAHWQNTLRETFPIEIETLEINDGTIRFLDRSRQPQVDVALSQFHLAAKELRTRPTGSAGALPATVDAEATSTGEGRLKIHLTVDPFSPQPRFDSQFELRALSLPALNPFLLAYANADVSRGTFEFDSEIHAEGGHYEGYVKPFFKDLDFKTASDKDKNALQLLTKKAVSAVATALKNDEENKVATKAPFSGDFAANDVDVWTTITGLLRNAFVQGIREGFEGQTPSR